MKTPLLARLVLSGFVAVFFVAVSYLLLDAFGLWSKLPESLTRGVDVVAGLVLLLALGAHLALATGKLPPLGGPTTRRD